MKFKTTLIAASAIVSTGAQAAPVVYGFYFTGSTVYRSYGSGDAPVSSVSGSFYVTIDNTQDYLNQTVGITSPDFNFPITGSLAFNYKAATDELAIGSINHARDNDYWGGYYYGDSVGSKFTHDNDFEFVFRGATTATPYNYSLAEITGNDSDFFLMSASVQRIAAAPAAVPEPASWAMMIGGFGLIGATMRRRQNVRVLFG